MHELSAEGDIRTMWDVARPEEVRAARTMIDEFTRPRSQGGRGYLAYRAGAEGEQGERMTEFDPDAERVILVHQLQGG